MFYVVVSIILVSIFMLIIYIFPSYNISYRDNSKPIKIYFADNISSAHRKLINIFNEKYRGQIEVIPIDLPFSKFSTNDRKELLARYFRSKSDRIDVFSVDQIWVSRFARWAIPLEEYFSNSDKAALLSYALKTCYYNDTLVAVPLYIDVALMYYRKDIIDKLTNAKEIENELNNSITWQQLIALNKEIKNNPLYVFQADDYEGLICSYIEILTNMDGQFMEKDSLLVKSPKAIEALQYLDDLFKKYKISPHEVLKFKEDDSYKYFFQDNAVFVRGWTGLFENNSVGIKYLNLKDKIEEVPTPHLEGSKPASVFGGWDLMISRFSTKIPAAVKFVKFLTSREAQTILFEDGGYIPTNNEIFRDSAYIVKHPKLNFYSRLLRHGIYRPFSEHYTKVSDILSYYINLSLKSKLTPHDALYRAYEKLNSKNILLK